MKSLLTLLIIFLGLNASIAQAFSSSDASKCQVQVAFAILEAEDFGEYSITELVPLNPGQSHDYRYEELTARRIYPDVDHDAMFIVRFEATGITHFLDATIPNGYETFLNGGCSVEQNPYVTRDGEFHISAADR